MQLPQVHSRSGDCSARGILVHVVPPDAQPRRERRHVLFHSSWQTNELSTTKGRSWWVGQCPQMYSCKWLPLLSIAENGQSVPRNTVSQQNIFLLLFTNKPYSMLRFQDCQSESALNRFYLECLLDQTASPRLCFKQHFQEQKYLLNF